jgi:hypothetical protein
MSLILAGKLSHPLFPFCLGLLTLLSDSLGLAVRPATEPGIEITAVACSKDAFKHVIVAFAVAPSTVKERFYLLAHSNLFVCSHDQYGDISVDIE